jgi:hypothetical protein
MIIVDIGGRTKTTRILLKTGLFWPILLILYLRNANFAPRSPQTGDPDVATSHGRCSSIKRHFLFSLHENTDFPDWVKSEEIGSLIMSSGAGHGISGTGII